MEADKDRAIVNSLFYQCLFEVVPDALFKIIVTPIGVLAYIYPQDHVEYSGRDHSQFQTTVDQIEKITDMNFRL
jgi:hypothetical protein